MEVLIRKAEQDDYPLLPAVLRNANDTLRQSRGGSTPDSSIELLNSKSDAYLQDLIRRNSVVFVAEARGTGQIVGMGAFTDDLLSRLVGSTYSRNHYVCAAFQGGRAGVGVGRLLREATIAEAKRQGFRKMYGFSTSEAAGFHRKFGAIFHPRHNARLLESVVFNYYEIELRRSPLNGVRIEPYLHRMRRLFGSALGIIRLRILRQRDF